MICTEHKTLGALRAVLGAADKADRSSICPWHAQTYKACTANEVERPENMEHLLIPEKRTRQFLEIAEDLGERLKCSLTVENGNEVIIKGEPFDEFNAKNVVQAFARGFEPKTAEKLLKENYFSKYVDMKDFLKNEEQVRRIKARIIGREGKTKLYIEEISGALISIYGNTIGIIGTIGELEIASAALQVLLEGGTHKKAYSIMERMRRKLNEAE